MPPPGTVEQEAALLVDLLSQRGWGRADHAERADDPDDSGRADDLGDAGHADDPGDAGDAGDAEGREDAEARGSGRHECTCGGRTPAACTVCPVCQLIAFVQQVNPETIDRVADFVAFAATALRDLATAQRERHGNAGDTQHPGGGADDGSSS